MSDIPGTPLSAPIVPFTTDDIYPTHESQYGKGGWREVSTVTDRDSIPIERRVAGMVVSVTNDSDPLNNVPWILGTDLTTYTKLTTSGGGGGDTTIIDGFTMSATNGTLLDMVAGQPVSMVSNQLKLADKVDPYRFRSIGLVGDPVIPSGGSGKIKTGGVLTLDDWSATVGTTLLMAGATYYLGSDGTLVTAPTYNPGEYIVLVGQASPDGKSMAIDVEVLMAV
jgi:hypothetical protein